MPGRAIGPTIGVTISSRATEKQRRHYRRALEEHAVAVVEIRPSDQSPAIDDYDALLLSGGGDLAPECYGEPVRAQLKNVDRNRDRLDLRLARAAVARGLPVLGICRGAQVLGVALGGRLIQDIGSEVSGALQHAADDSRHEAWHAVELAPESRLSEVLRATHLPVNSFHHQANGSLGPQVRQAAWAEDGVVEAVERDGDAFALGVQWHPERMLEEHPGQRLLFEAFVAAAHKYRTTSSQPEETRE